MRVVQKVTLLPTFIILFVAVMMLFSVAAETENSCRRENFFVRIVPSTTRNVCSSTRNGGLWDPVVLEQVVVDVNAWGLQGYEDELRGYIDLIVDERGVFRLVASLDLTKVGLKPWNVIAYPEIIYGAKPWNLGPRGKQEKVLTLPLSVRELPEVFALVDYAVINTSTAINLAFDMWILRGQEFRTPTVGDIELMVWLYRGGAQEIPHPAGEFFKTIKVLVISDGLVEETEFEVWVEKKIGGGWTYIAFTAKNTSQRRELILNLSLFIDEALKLLELNPENYYLFSVELGFEVFHSRIVNVNASIYKYYLIVSSEVTDIGQLLTTTPRSNRLVAWITPWGYDVNIEEFGEQFTPGVILAYDIDCGLCTYTLRAWANTSLKLIKSSLERGKIVYINMFSEKYYPSWKWRGELTKVVLKEEVLQELKEIVRDGEYVYLGFSEMTTCVNNEKCLKELIRAYEELRELFPAARLYYYGSGGDSVENLLELYTEARLDVIGIDVWSYRYVINALRIDDHLAEKIKQLLKVTKSQRIFIGEVGLRLNDKEAYVEPWNKNRPLVKVEGIHKAYYEQVLEHLRELGFINGYLGVWSWNDEVYAIMKDSDVQKLIALKASALGVLPQPCRELEATKTTTAVESKYALLVQVLIVLAVLVAVFATLLLKWPRKA